MASVVPQNLVPTVALTTGAVAYIAGAPSSKTIVQKATLSNVTAGAVTFTMYRVPSGGSAGAGNTIVQTKGLAAGEVYIANELNGLVLDPGDTIQALASAGASINFTASGVIFVP